MSGTETGAGTPRLPRLAALALSLVSLGALALGAVWYGLHAPDLPITELELAGTADRAAGIVGDRPADFVRAVDADWLLILGYAVAIVVAGELGRRVFWTRRARALSTVARWAAVAAAVADAVENLLLRDALTTTTTGDPQWTWAQAAAFTKFGLLAVAAPVALTAVAFTLGKLAVRLVRRPERYAEAFVQAAPPLPPEPGSPLGPVPPGAVRTPGPGRWDEAAALPPGRVPARVGICASGGGIRSACVTLGALQSLREAGELQRADYLVSVSGGGYAAGAFQLALQPRPDGADPNAADPRTVLSPGSLEEGPPAPARPLHRRLRPGVAARAGRHLPRPAGLADADHADRRRHRPGARAVLPVGAGRRARPDPPRAGVHDRGRLPAPRERGAARRRAGGRSRAAALHLGHRRPAVGRRLPAVGAGARGGGGARPRPGRAHRGPRRARRGHPGAGLGVRGGDRLVRRPAARHPAGLYCTDGGHYENLGLVELLRHRCRLVYCLDASGDSPPFATTLAEAITLAYEEMGVRIELGETADDLVPGRARSPLAPGDPLAPLAARMSKSGVVVGRIRYPSPVSWTGVPGPSQDGILVVAKASLAEDLPYELRAYAAANPVFPRDSTSDQWFDHGQFDAYQGLGRHLGRCAAEAGIAAERRLDRPPSRWPQLPLRSR